MNFFIKKAQHQVINSYICTVVLGYKWSLYLGFSATLIWAKPPWHQTSLWMTINVLAANSIWPHSKNFFDQMTGHDGYDGTVPPHHHSSGWLSRKLELSVIFQIISRHSGWTLFFFSTFFFALFISCLFLHFQHLFTSCPCLQFCTTVKLLFCCEYM